MGLCLRFFHSCTILYTTFQKCGVLTQQCVVFEDILIAAKGAKSGGFYTVGVYDSLSADDEDAMRSICDRYIYNFNEMKGYLL